MEPSQMAALAATTGFFGAGQDAPPVDPFETAADMSPQGRIDELVFARWKKLSIKPARLCSDGVFVRRAYLDTIGTLPTMEEARGFLADKSPQKRRALVERLLDRDEFADYWAMKWCDLLRVKAEFPINLWPNAAQAYHRWIRASVKDNVPYDRFVRELLTSSGSNFRVPQVNFYRAVQSREPEALAQAVALTFMGVRAEKWPREKLAGMGAFFAQLAYKPTGEWKEEIVRFDPDLAAKGPARQAVFPDGVRAKLSDGQDPRFVFANWLITADNPWFARNAVNRVWSWLLGRGIVHEPDDVRSDNPPSNADLLDHLARELVAAKYDLKPIYRQILSSRTYQLSSLPRGKHPQADAQFAVYPLRRLEAEVLADALNQVTGGTEKYTSAIPEPFSFIPEKSRSIALPDGSITSSFLEMFGRPPRDTGMESERNNRLTAAQSLHLLNSSHVQRKIAQSSKLGSLISANTAPREAAERIYLTLLSRYPTEHELRSIAGHVSTTNIKGRDVITDLAWALINSTEFLYRH